MTQYVLRQYQSDAVGRGCEYILTKRKKPRNGLIYIPTGGGKALVAGSLALELSNHGNVVVLQPGREILQQNLEKIQSYGFRPSVFSASMNSREIGAITMATIGSIFKHPEWFQDFQFGIIDECFPDKQFIATEKGKTTIGFYVRQFQKGLPMPRVLSYNETLDTMEFKKVQAVAALGERPLVKLRFSKNRQVKCTRSHRFLTLKGWCRAGDLQRGDVILCSASNGSYAPIPNPDQVAIILGGVLGDMSVDSTRRVLNINRFRITHGAPQFEYIQWKATMLGGEPYFVDVNGFAGKPAYAFSSNVFCFPDSQCETDFAIKNITAQTLAISWMDDGSLAQSDNSRLYSTAPSERQTRLLARYLQKRLGIKSTARSANSSSSGKQYWYLDFNQCETRRIGELIAPFVHPSMAYKIPVSVRHRAGEYHWDPRPSLRGGMVFLSRQRIRKAPVFDIQVEDNHSFVIPSSRDTIRDRSLVDGMIVHNCHLVGFKDNSHIVQAGEGLTFYHRDLGIVSEVENQEGVGKGKVRIVDDDGVEDVIARPKTPMYKTFSEALPHMQWIGLSASPYRLVSNAMGSQLKVVTRTLPRMWHDFIHWTQYKELFDAGYLSKLDYYQIPGFKRSRVTLNSSGSDFDKDALQLHLWEKLWETKSKKAVNFPDKLTEVVSRVLDAGRRNALVFVGSIREAEYLATQMGGVCGVITGETPSEERAAMIRDFKVGTIPAIANVNVLGLGFDFPELECLIDAYPTMSLARYDQKLGRLTRAHANKKSGWAIDMAGGYEQFGKLEHRMLYCQGNTRWDVFGRPGGGVEKMLTSTWLAGDPGCCPKCGARKFLAYYENSKKWLPVSEAPPGMKPKLVIKQDGKKRTCHMAEPGEKPTALFHFIACNRFSALRKAA